MNDDLRTVVNAFPVVTWLSSKVKVSDTGGANVQLDCPVCRGRNKLGVHRVKKVAQCFKCSEGGGGGTVWNGRVDLIGLIRLLDLCDYRQAVRTIYSYAGIAEPKWERLQPISRSIPEESFPLRDVSPLHPSRVWLRSRGVEHLAECSHVCVDGDYEGRVILPATWFDETAGWEAKTYTNSKPKSLFPEWFETSHNVYTTQQWDAAANFCVITESIFDAETYKINAIGLYGSTLREGQLMRLLDLKARGISRLVWCLDYDAWKKQASAILTRTGLYFENLVCDLPKWKDPNQLGWAKCWELVREAKIIKDSTDLVLFGLDR
jgi:hypothetical protein